MVTVFGWRFSSGGGGGGADEWTGSYGIIGPPAGFEGAGPLLAVEAGDEGLRGPLPEAVSDLLLPAGVFEAGLWGRELGRRLVSALDGLFRSGCGDSVEDGTSELIVVSGSVATTGGTSVFATSLGVALLRDVPK